MSERQDKEKKEKRGHVPFGQVILDDMFLLLLLGITVPFMIYLAWGYIDLASLPSMPDPEFATTSTQVPSTNQGPDALTLINANGCLACHSTDGTARVGPSWQGLYESTRTLADSSTVVADEDYITQSILDPNSQVVAGYSGGIMPSYGDQLSSDEVAAIVEYIKGLE